MSPERHWTALDRAFSDLLPAHDVQRGRERFPRHAAALSEVYVPRLLAALQQTLGDDGDSMRQLAKIRRTHARLSAALTDIWRDNR